MLVSFFFISALVIPPSLFEAPGEGKPALVSLKDADGSSISLAIWNVDKRTDFDIEAGPKKFEITHLKCRVYRDVINLSTTYHTKFTLLDEIEGMPSLFS